MPSRYKLWAKVRVLRSCFVQAVDSALFIDLGNMLQEQVPMVRSDILYSLGVWAIL